MQIIDLPFGTNIMIPERQQDGSYKMADYTLGCINNFGPGTAGCVRKDIYSMCRFGDTTHYETSDLDKRMGEIFDSYPEELKGMILRAEFPLYDGRNAEPTIMRKVFALTCTMTGFDTNWGVPEGLAWPIFNGSNSRQKTFDGRADVWWLSSRYNTSYSRSVYSDGTAYCNYPSTSRGVVPAFIIPQSLQIEDSANTDGSYKLAAIRDYYAG